MPTRTLPAIQCAGGYLRTGNLSGTALTSTIYSGSFWIRGWMRIDSTAALSRLFFISPAADLTQRCAAHLDPRDPSSVGFEYYATTAGIQEIDSLTSIGAATYNVDVVYDKPSFTAKMYINNVLVMNQQCVNSSAVFTTTPAAQFTSWINANSTVSPTSRSTNASLQVWDFVPSDAQRIYYANNEPTGSETGLVLYVPFSEGSGTHATDIVHGLQYNFTLYNGSNINWTTLQVGDPVPTIPISSTLPTSATAPQVVVTSGVNRVYFYCTINTPGSIAIFAQSSSTSNNWYLLDSQSFNTAGRSLEWVDFDASELITGLYLVKYEPLTNVTVDYTVQATV